jgi:truncated hemoglobin YjbI
MTISLAGRSLTVLALVAALGGCASMGKKRAFDQLGGMDQIRALSDSFVNNVASDSRTSSLLSGSNLSSMKSKLSDQLCAMSGGKCSAPLSNAQIAEAGKKVNPSTSSALTDSFSRALDSIKANPVVKETVTKTMGPQLGGIVASLL